MSTQSRALIAIATLGGVSRADLAIALMDMTDRAEKAERALVEMRSKYLDACQATLEVTRLLIAEEA